MKLAVCLLTADRPGYTCDTLASYIEHADQPGFIRLHADDGSRELSNMRAAEAAGFDTVYRTTQRSGMLSALRVMWCHAVERGATHILHLENDQQFTRGLVLRDDVECTRLYGAYKSDRGDRSKTGPHIMGTKEVIRWYPDAPGWERGLAHWGGQPSITVASLLCPAVERASCVKEISLLLARLDTLRPVKNITNHTGDVRTPDAKFNA